MTYVDDAGLRKVLMDLESDFSLEYPLADFDSVERIESRTAMIYVVSGEGIPSAVVKAGKGWVADTAQRVYEDLTALSAMFASTDQVSIRVPKIMGWHDSPPSVSLAFVEGEDLSQLLSRREGYMSSEVERAMSEIGAALGVYHSEEVKEAAKRKHLFDIAEIRRSIVRMARKVGIRNPLLPPDLETVVARRYGDFAPYNIKIASDGTVWLLDQPSDLTMAPTHHDVSYFLGRVEGRLGRDESGSRSSLRAVQTRLEETFMNAYDKTAPRPLRSDEDQALIATYRAHRSLMTARKRFTQSRYTEILRYLRSARYWRAQALPRS